MKKQKIKRDMVIGDIIHKHPKTVEVFIKHGFHCIGCHAMGSETIEQGAMVHGMNDKEMEKFMKELNSKA